MKAIRIHQHGDPAQMQYEDVPTPKPSEGEILVKIAAAGLNFIDAYHRTGLYPTPLPLILGLEAAGTVEALGPNVSEFQVGDKVAYCSHQGAYAEYATVPVAIAVPVPDELALDMALASLLQGMTAHYLVHSTYPVKEGDTILVHAAAGGTGALIVQMAKRLGATVIGTVSTEEKAERARQVGTDHVIRYTETDFEAETKRLTNGVGVHAVYDSVGQTTFDKSLAVLRPLGYLALFGQSSGLVPSFDLSRLSQGGSLFITRPTLFHYIASREDLLRRAGDVFRWVALGDLTLHIDRHMPLAEAAEAHRLLEGRQTSGKVLLLPK